jgi:thiamine pyrophosphokinase
MHVVIVAGGMGRALPDRASIAGADLVIAADGGAEALVALGVQPHVLVGDFDSVSAATRSRVEGDGAEVIALRADKDWTDTEVALRLAVERGAERVTVFGALGGPRLDHLLGNILLLTAPWLRGCDVRLVDARHEIFLAGGDANIAGKPGDLVSLLSLTPLVEAVETEGLAYPLQGEPLYQGATRGVSNELLEDRARVRHGTGELLIVHYRSTEEGPRETAC